MKITWKGETCFEISSTSSEKENILISIDDFDGKKKSNADIILRTHNLEPQKQGKVNDQFIISSWGEYESKGVFVQAIPSFDMSKKQNIIYLIEAEDIRVCHLGLLGQKDLGEEQLEAMGRVDILIVPINGDKTINFREAEEMIAKIEPSIVIPMSFEKKESLNAFLKAMGEKEIVPQDKLNISKKHLSGKEKNEKTEIIVLESK